MSKEALGGGRRPIRGIRKQELEESRRDICTGGVRRPEKKDKEKVKRLWCSFDVLISYG